MPGDLETQVAVVKNDVQHLRDDVSELKSDLKVMHAQNDVRLKNIEDFMAQTKGGWRAIASAGAIGGTIVATIGGLVLKLWGKI